MANFDFDQAEGLRRMLAGPKPRVVTLLCATPEDDKGAMLVNLAASLSQSGNDVLVVDACQRDYGIASRLGVDRNPTLVNVARQECGLNQVIRSVPQGFSVARLSRRGEWPTLAESRRLDTTFEVLAKQHGIVMVDGELAEGEAFPVRAMESSEIVIQVGTSAESIKAGYALIKRLALHLGRRPFGLLVTGASEGAARVVYDNMASAASKYLAVQLTSMGSVPADEYLHRAASLGRAVVDAFPLAGASVAFRRLAGRVAGGGLSPTGTVPGFLAGNTSNA